MIGYQGGTRDTTTKRISSDLELATKIRIIEYRRDFFFFFLFQDSTGKRRHFLIGLQKYVNLEAYLACAKM